MTRRRAERRRSSTRVGVIGAGRVGSALALALARVGPTARLRFAGIFTRRSREARRLVRRCRRGKAFAASADLARASDVIVVCVPDAEIEAVARTLSSAASLRGKVILHTSGNLDLGPLRPARASGAAGGALHPLASFPPPGAPAATTVSWPTVWFALAGDPPARGAARRIVTALGGHRLPRVRDGGAYHLAAAMTANFPTVLASIALGTLARRGGPSGRGARAAFASLLRSAADRIEHEGPTRGLTGPAARGDIGTLRRHLAVLERSAPRWCGLYLLLGAEAVRMARRRGSLSASRAAAALRWLHRAARVAPRGARG